MIFGIGFAIARLLRIGGLRIGGLALAVLAASLATPALAQQCVTVGTNQTCTNAIFLSGGATGITDDATLDVTNLASGTIAGTATDATGAGVNANGVSATTADVNNLGAISATATETGVSSAAVAFNIEVTTANVMNSGTISTVATAIMGGLADATDILANTTANVTNSGMISTVATTSGIGGFARAVNIEASTTANVTNSGTISAMATGTAGANSVAEGIINCVTCNVMNSGTISVMATETGGPNGGIAEAFDIDGATTANVTNSGAITANASAMNSLGTNTPVLVVSGGISGGTANVTNSGAITANASVANSPGTNNNATAFGIELITGNVTNSGTITANASAINVAGTVNGATSVGILADGDTATATANVTNSGTITAMATGSGAQAFGIQAFTTASVNNSGTIKAVATGSGALSFGIAAATVNVVNSGLVSGGTGIAAGATSQIASPGGGTHSTIVNSGTIIGTNGVAIDFTGQSLAALPGAGTAISSSNDTLTLLPGSRILGEILLGTNDTVNIDIGSRLSSVLTLNFGDATGAHGLSGTGAVVNVVTTELSVVHGNEIATLEPTALALTDRTLLDFTGGVSSLIQGRLGEVADPAGTVFAGGGSSLVTSYAAAPGANPNLPTKKAPTTAPSPLQTIVVWANAFGGGHVQASDGPDLRATHSYGGVAFGLDAQALPNLRLGAFLGGGFGQLAVAQGSQHIDTDYITGGIYGHYSFGAPFLDFNLFGGTTHNNSTRLVNSLGTGGLETATGSYGGSFVSPELALGWRIEDLGNGLVWTPAARLRYVAGWFDRYAETGSTQNLVVNSRSLQDVEGRLELAVSKALPFGDGLIGLQAKAGVIGLTRLGSTSTEVNLIGADFSFPTPGRNQDFGAYAGLGVDYKVTATISAFASAEGTVLTHSSRYGTARAGFQVKFW